MDKEGMLRLLAEGSASRRGRAGGWARRRWRRRRRGTRLVLAEAVAEVATAEAAAEAARAGVEAATAEAAAEATIDRASLESGDCV